MRLVMMNGGLGNQIFQYIFMRWLEEKTGEPCVIDNLAFLETPYARVEHNGYELERLFGIKHTCISDLLDWDVIEEIKRLLFVSNEDGTRGNLIDIFKANSLELFPIQEGDCYSSTSSYKGSIFSTPMNEFYPDILRCTGDLYYYGYWINGRWFNNIKATILKELVFPPIPDAKNQAYMEEIKAAGDKSLAVHFRRGDFVTLGWTLSLNFYSLALIEMRKRMENPKMFVFSDDIPWVKENFNEIGFLPTDDIVFVEGNMGGNNYIDMQLMTSCRGMIIANSSFSYLAALLNQNPDKLVANPTTREIF